LLDEFCQLCGFERKYAIKLLGGKRRVEGALNGRSGSKPKYGEAEREVLKAIWLADEQPCGKRLKAAVPLWLPDYEREEGPLEESLRVQILKISAASMDRLLAPSRAGLGSRGNCGTRPGTLLRSQIPIRTEHWDVSGPGWLEPVHCGRARKQIPPYSATCAEVTLNARN